MKSLRAFSPRTHRGAVGLMLVSAMASNGALADGPEIDTTPEVVAVAIKGRGVLAVVVEEQAVYRVTGARSSRIDVDTDERTTSVLDACSRSSTSADGRALCESTARLSLPAVVSTSPAQPDRANAITQAAFVFDRESDTQGIATMNAAGKAVRVRISTSDELLTRVRYLGATSTGQSLLLAESLRQQSGALNWRAIVASFDASGRRVGMLEIDSNDKNLPNGDYVVANERGDVGVMKLKNGKLTVEWRPLKAAVDSGGSRSESEEPETPPAAEAVDAFDYEDFARLSSQLDGDGLRASDGPISRTEVLANADAYLQARWTMGQDNYEHPGRQNLCSPSKGHVWRRPARLDNSVGQTHTAPPYKWGGFLSVQGLYDRLKAKKLAGSVCACSAKNRNYCIVEEAAGVDCSGFVSRVWEVDRHTTRNLADISNSVKWKDLRKGDIVNLPGSHVRLFLEISRGTDIGFRIMESSVSCGGVCEKVLGARELERYEPRRYKYILEE